MATNNFDPIKEGATPFNPTGEGGIPVTSPAPTSISNQVSDLMRSVGLGIFPNMAANAVDLAKGVSNVAQGKGKLNITSGDYSNPFRSQDQAKEALSSSPITSGLKDTAGLASWTAVPEIKAIQGANLGAKAANLALRGGVRGELFATSQGDPTNPIYAATGAILDPLASGLTSGLTTQRGVNNAMKMAKDASVAKGITQTYGDFSNEVGKVLSEVDPSNLRPELRKAVQSELTSRLPANKTITSVAPSSETTSGIERSQTLGSPSLDAGWFHDLRMALDDELGPKYWQDVQNNPVKSQAKGVLRSAASNMLHTMAPETQFLDQLNHLYYNPLIKGGRLPIVGNIQHPSAITGVPSALINGAIGTLLGGSLAKKIGF